MILNPSHDITLKGLPADILDAYVRYKKGSRAIVAWLVRFGSKKYRGLKTLPIKELASLATSVTHTVKEVPEVIHFHFRETIAARKRLSQFFRNVLDSTEEDSDTANHEHFTASLTEIYANLCRHCGDQQNLHRSTHHVAHTVLLAAPIKNHYACLPVEHCTERPLSVHGDVTGVECGNCQQDQIHDCPGPQGVLVIENDEMSIAIETASTLQEIDTTLKVVEACWQEAARGEAHFVSAAAITNSAWTHLRELEGRLKKEEEESLNIDLLHQRCCLFKEAAGEAENPLARVHTLLSSLVDADRAVTHYLDCHKFTVIADCPSCVQKPGDYIQQSEAFVGNSMTKTTTFPLAIMDNMLHLICGKKPSVIVLQSSPIFANIEYLLSHQDDRSSTFQCILGVHLLTMAYKAYLNALVKPSTVSTCRITALHLAKEASSTIGKLLKDKDSFPCHCTETLAFHLVNLKSTADSFAAQKCWDLYFQCPWVAGNHIIEMLDMLSYYGMRLLQYRHYVAAILHSYNILVQLADLEPIPILEQVCKTFESVFFPAGRPKSHFKNCWARYIGARLRFNKEHKRHGNDKDSWCMAVPAHAAKSAAGLGFGTDRRQCIKLEPKFDYGRVDPVMRLKQLDWHFDLPSEKQMQADPSDELDGLFCGEASNLSAVQPKSDHRMDQPLIHPLLAYLHSLDNSITGSYKQLSDTLPSTDSQTTFPTTRFNHLAFFGAMTRLIRIITGKIHSAERNSEGAKPSVNSSKSSGSNLCICFIHTLVAGADRIVEGRRFGGVACWTKSEREEVVNVVTNVLKGEMMTTTATPMKKKNQKLGEEWLWCL